MTIREGEEESHIQPDTAMASNAVVEIEKSHENDVYQILLATLKELSTENRDRIDSMYVKITRRLLKAKHSLEKLRNGEKYNGIFQEILTPLYTQALLSADENLMSDNETTSQIIQNLTTIALLKEIDATGNLLRKALSHIEAIKEAASH